MKLRNPIIYVSYDLIIINNIISGDKGLPGLPGLPGIAGPVGVCIKLYISSNHFYNI